MNSDSNFSSQLQRHEFEHLMRSVYHEEFQCRVLNAVRLIHSNAQSVVLKQGDGGKDIVVYDKGRIYACYAPARLPKDLNEAELIRKIDKDFKKALSAVAGGLVEWIFVHNHPANALSNKSSDHLLQLRQENQAVKLIDVWGIEQLWENLPSLHKDQSPGQRVVARAIEIAKSGEVVKALEWMDQALPEIRNAKDANDEARVLIRMSGFSTQHGGGDKARWLDEARKVMPNVTDPVVRIQFFQAEASLLRERRSYTEALERYDEALAVRIPLAGPQVERALSFKCWVRADIVHLLCATKQPERVSEHLNECESYA